SAISRTDGAFALEELPAGRYTLRVAAPGALRRMVRDVEAGARDVLIEVPRGGSLEGTLVGFATPPRVAVVTREGRVSARVAGGRFVFSETPPASYLLSAVTDSEADSVLVEVKADETAHAVLTSHGEAKVEGRVVSFPTGAPVTGARCLWRHEPGDARA